MEPQEQQINPFEIDETSPVEDGMPYFLGEHALVKFTGGRGDMGPGVFWLLDKTNHTLRPFESNKALESAFGEGLQEALQNVMVVNSPTIDSEGEITDGILSDFTVLGPEYAIREDGSSEPLEFSSHQLRGRYGKEVNEGGESLAADILEGFLDLLKQNDVKTGISKQYIDTIKQNSKLMAFYISALAYGDYTLQEVYSDMARRFHNSKK